MFWPSTFLLALFCVYFDPPSSSLCFVSSLYDSSLHSLLFIFLVRGPFSAFKPWPFSFSPFLTSFFGATCRGLSTKFLLSLFLDTCLSFLPAIQGSCVAPELLFFVLVSHGLGTSLFLPLIDPTCFIPILVTCLWCFSFLITWVSSVRPFWVFYGFPFEFIQHQNQRSAWYLPLSLCVSLTRWFNPARPVRISDCGSTLLVTYILFLQLFSLVFTSSRFLAMHFLASLLPTLHFDELIFDNPGFSLPLGRSPPCASMSPVSTWLTPSHLFPQIFFDHT